jgi:hypothetical protein
MHALPKSPAEKLPGGDVLGNNAGITNTRGLKVGDKIHTYMIKNEEQTVAQAQEIGCRKHNACGFNRAPMEWLSTTVQK